MIDPNLLLICKSQNVASLAGFNTLEWSTNHVFAKSRHFIKGINRGRLPVLLLYTDQTTDYVSETTSINEGGGTQTSVYTIEVITGRNDDEAGIPLLKEIIRQINVNTSWSLFGSDMQILAPESDPWGYTSKLQITSRNSY